MKKITVLISLLLLSALSDAQVGMGTTNPEASLDVIGNATNLTLADGIIAPRLSRLDLVAKVAVYGVAQTGAIVYVNDISGTPDAATALVTSVGYYFFDGTAWQTFTSVEEQSKWTNNVTDSRVELTAMSNGLGRGVLNAFHIEDAGDVGIGVVDPNQKLSVGGNMNTIGNLELGQIATGDRNIVLDFHTSDTGDTDYKARILRNAGENGSFNILNRGTSNINIHHIDLAGISLSIEGTNGYVGINNANPTQPLEVNGNGLVQNSLFVTGVPADGERGLRMHTSAANSAFFDVNANSSPFSSTNRAYTWRGDNVTGVTELMRLLYNGDLEIERLLSTGGNLELGQQATGSGNRNILIDFHTSDTGSADYKARLIRNNGDNGDFNMINRGTGNLNFDTLNAAGTSLTILGTDGFVGINRTTPTEQLDVDGNGLFSGTVTAGGVLLTSDARLKTNIVAIENSLETIQQLNPVYYNKKQALDSNNSRKEFGFIAQEVQEILPQLVKQTTGKDKILGVDYVSLIPILTKALQEQQIQLDSKTRETEELKAKLSKLESEIEAIKKMLKM